jgi:hypothetical protein
VHRELTVLHAAVVRAVRVARRCDVVAALV